MQMRTHFTMRGITARAAFGLTLLATSATAQLQLRTVPWQGDVNKQHQVYAGGTLMLQGVADIAVGCPLVSATWDPGDGSGPISVPITNPRVLELPHVYNGVNNQPYTATLTVTDSCGTMLSDQFRVVVVSPRTLTVDINMAIDHGLWNLHKRQVLSSVGGVATGYWPSASGYSNNITAATASCVQAFEVHGHHPNGNQLEDPYVDDVNWGLAHLPTALSAVSISPQTAGDPDANGNGIGLQVTSDAIYVGGQVIDAFVASGTPNAVTQTGSTNVIGRTYAEIVQDLLDMYAWGQSESSVYRGAWRYSWNADADNSAAQWWAIGGIAAERGFGSVVPQFVKDENLNFWLAYSQFRNGTGTGLDGNFGYTAPSSFAWDSGMNTTPSGLVQLVMSGIPSSDPRFVDANAYIARNWSILINNTRLYGLFATAKAMRLASPPVTFLTSGATSIDWYANDVNAGDAINGAARRLCDTQQADGSWDEQLVRDDLATAWAAIILSSTIVQPGPVAICDVDPELTAATFVVNYDASLSYHVDPNRMLVNYEWDFDGDGTYDATGIHVTHSYAAQGTYNVGLRVTDDSTPSPLQSVSHCTVQITPPPYPPDSYPGGPYNFCANSQPWILDGSGSSDPDGTIVLYEWDFSPQPLDLSFNDATGPTADVTAFFSSLPPGTYDVGLRVHDDVGNVNTDYTVIHILGANDPLCQIGAPTLTCPPDFTEVWNGGIQAGQTDPSRTGTATYNDACTANVQLTWADISVLPNTPQTPGAPEVVITRRWTLTDGCGGQASCDQTITLLSPSGQAGGLTLDVSPNICPNEFRPTTRSMVVTIPGTWAIPATDIVPGSIRIRRADGVGGQVKLGAGMLGPIYADVTRPYYGQNGPCSVQSPEGRADFSVIVSGLALRNKLKLGAMPDGALVNLIVTGRRISGETISLMDWITVRH